MASKQGDVISTVTVSMEEASETALRVDIARNNSLGDEALIKLSDITLRASSLPAPEYTPSSTPPSQPSSFQSSQKSATGGSSLILDIMVKDLAYEKEVWVRLTADAWKTFRDVKARFVESGSSFTGRFAAEVDLASENIVLLLKENGEGSVQLEFALGCLVGESEAWDNNGGRNYVLVLKMGKPAPAIEINATDPDVNTDERPCRSRQSSIVPASLHRVAAPWPPPPSSSPTSAQSAFSTSQLSEIPSPQPDIADSSRRESTTPRLQYDGSPTGVSQPHPSPAPQKSVSKKRARWFKRKRSVTPEKGK